jgi:monovalent cation/hydrogen antiporter
MAGTWAIVDSPADVADLEFLFLLLLGAAAIVRGAAWLHVPYPIALVLVGLAAGAIPGLPEVVIEPDVLFLVFLPPLLASAGFYSSPRELRAEWRPLTVLALGAVLATTCGVAVAAHELIDGLGWPAAFVLGAVVAPTDPVAAQATFSRMHVPERVGMLVEGEAMINDASALVAFRVALGAAIAGSFSVADAALDFVVSAVAGVAIGLAAGWVEVKVLRKLNDRPLAILLSLLFPYAAYVAAEEAHVSGVLAAVTCGLYLGWFSHETFSADTRLSASAFWEVLVFGLNALLFLLLGLQFPAIVDDARAGDTFGTLLLTALMIAAVVVAIRTLVVFLPFTRTGESWRERLAIAWSGMRGAISLAAALSVPATVSGQPDIVFVTVVVILVTLVGQGLTLPALLRFLQLRGRAPVVARRGDRAAGDRPVRARPDRRARGRGRRRRGAAASHARALPRALPRLPGGAGRRRPGRYGRRAREPAALLGPAPRADRRRARRAAGPAQRGSPAPGRAAADPARPRSRGGAALVRLGRP